MLKRVGDSGGSEREKGKETTKRRKKTRGRNGTLPPGGC